MIPWAHTTHRPKHQLDQFHHFCTADAAFFLCIKLRRPISPKVSPSRGRSGPHKNIIPSAQLTYHTKQHLDQISHFPTIHTCYQLIDRDRGSVLLWWLFDMLCTSGFVDAVMFSHNGYYRAS